MPKPKKCTGCKEEKPAELFGNDSRNKNGLKSRCKDCDKKAAQARQARRAKLTDNGKAKEESTPVDRLRALLPLQPFDNKDPALWMVKAAATYVELISAAPTNRTLHYAAGTVARLVAAARGYIQTAELEQQLSVLEERMVQMEEAATSGAGYVSAKALRNAASDSTGEPVH